MVCKSCRSQARSLLRTAFRAGISRGASTTARTKPLCGVPPVSQLNILRSFSNTSPRELLGASFRDSYRVLGVSERLFKVCARPANYHITEDERKQDLVKKLEDGEEVGHAAEKTNVWHNIFNLPPTFSTWSHVTMLHLYLLNARLRCFEREEYRNWQQQMIDHFFFECEKKMHIDHHITSSALRQRYLKDIFVQWRGLLLAYDEGLIKGDAILASAVWRNLFKGSPDVDPRSLVAVVGWMRSSLASLEAASDATFPQRAQEVLEKPVDVFWKRIEEPLKKREQEGSFTSAKRGAPVEDAPPRQSQTPAHI